MRVIVNDEVINEAMIQREMDRLRADHDRTFSNLPVEEREAQLRKWAKENVIEHVLLAQEARRRNYSVDEAILASRFAELVKNETISETEAQQLKADLRLEMQLGQLIQELLQSVSPPTEKTLRRYYEENQTEFFIPEQVNAAHIVFYITQKQSKIQAYQKIKKVKKRLEAGESFETLAKTVSECKEWRLGWFSRGQMVPSFEDAVFALKPGEISDIILTEFGYHIARLYDYQPQKLIPFEEVKPLIEENLTNEQLQHKIFQLADYLKEQATIVEEED